MKSEINHRRIFLKKLGYLGVAVPAFGLACSQESQLASETSEGSKGNSSLAVRKNIADLALDDPEIKLLKDALSILKKRSEVSPLDPSGWQAQGMLHTTFCAMSIYSNQVHYNWYVWPWHRLYLWSLEQKLQKAVQEPTLALPYWDWTKRNIIPAHYWGDESNPLFNKTREVGPEDEIPVDFINVGAAFRTHGYRTFGGYPAISKKGESQLDGIAEQSFHNNIHNWIGGQMATFTESGFDPVFYGHHGNCDRIWDAWQNYDQKNVVPDEEAWLEKRLFATDGNGKPVDFKIKDLLDTKQLGYRFADLDLNPTFCNPYMEESKPKRENSGQECIAPLNLESSKTDKIYTALDKKERTHIVVHFDRAQLPYQPYCARVFFECNLNGKL
ncbi:MAG: tyrosinase family protein, partial [Bacteroidota bacterium]